VEGGKDEDTVQRVRGGGGGGAVLRGRGSAVLGVRQEDSRGQQAGQHAPEGPSLQLLLSDAQV
jgi:molybdenum-dependent DNA-binding transcriptional regulator ModE